MDFTTKKIVMLVLAVLGFVVLVSLFRGYLPEEQPSSTYKGGAIQGSIENGELKALGTKIGIAYTKYQEGNQLLKVFSVGNPTEIVDTITVDELRKFSHGPNFSVHEVIYDKNFKGFVIVVEDLPYTGGSAGNSSWDIFVYDEDDRIPQLVLSSDGMGTTVPSDLVFSPSGIRLAYTHGIKGGPCGYVFDLEGIDLEEIKPFEFQGEIILLLSKSMNSIVEYIFPSAYAGAPIWRERKHSPINSDVLDLYPKLKNTMDAGELELAFSFSDLEWENNNIIRGKYHLTVCNPASIRGEIIQDFKVTVSK